MKYEHMCFLFSLVYNSNFNNDKKQMNYVTDVCLGNPDKFRSLKFKGEILFDPAKRNVCMDILLLEGQ